MTDEAAFIAAIQQDPQDLSRRLVYADWLEERDPLKSELLRVACERHERRMTLNPPLGRNDFRDAVLYAAYASGYSESKAPFRLSQLDKRLLELREQVDAPYIAEIRKCAGRLTEKCETCLGSGLLEKLQEYTLDFDGRAAESRMVYRPAQSPKQAVYRCSTCEGQGWIPTTLCADCGGFRAHQPITFADGTTYRYQGPQCETCGGFGKVFSPLRHWAEWLWLSLDDREPCVRRCQGIVWAPLPNDRFAWAAFLFRHEAGRQPVAVVGWSARRARWGRCYGDKLTYSRSPLAAMDGLSDDIGPSRVHILPDLPSDGEIRFYESAAPQSAISAIAEVARFMGPPIIDPRAFIKGDAVF